MNEIQKVILQMITEKGSTSPQGAYAHLAVYNKMEVTVDQARRALNSLVDQGFLSKSAGHGSVRSTYSLKGKK